MTLEVDEEGTDSLQPKIALHGDLVVLLLGQSEEAVVIDAVFEEGLSPHGG